MTNGIPYLTEPRCHGSGILDAWNSLIASKRFDAKALRPEIAASWERCVTFAIDPHGVGETVVATEETMDDNQMLATVATPHMRTLHSLLQDQGFLVMLYSPQGYVLTLLGDRKTVSLAEKLNVFPGASNAEELIGTCAPGICLAERKAVQVRWHEHFREIYHNWCCSAVPIFTADKKILGVLDVTSVDQPRHPAALLNLVQLTANAVEAEFNHRAMQGDYRKLHAYFNAVMDTVSDALVVFDTSDSLAHMNAKARELLNTGSKTIIGSDARSLVSNYDSVKCGLRVGRRLTELHFFSSSLQAVEVEAHVKSIPGASPSDPPAMLGILGRKHKRPDSANKARYGFQDFKFAGRLMGRLIDDAKKMAATRHTVLIQGESGTGKEVLAQAMHLCSPCRNGPFVAINCAALPRELIQSELFGYEGGSFTGASRHGKPGKFELAAGGTIFLDEIGDMPLDVQANLLRVLQERMVVRIGGSQARPLDVRVIAATNKDLFREVGEGRFRSDLFYRLSVISLHIPPLREHRDDIETLLRHFIEKHTEWSVTFEDIHLDENVLSALQTHDWPGNVRELENTVIFFLTKMRGNRVTPEDLPAALNPGAARRSQETEDLEAVERRAIRSALLQCRGNISSAAKFLGIGRATLYRKIAKHRL